MAPKKQPPATYTVPEVAVLARVPESTMYMLVAAGRVPGAIRIGRRWRLGRPTIDAWLAGRGEPA